MLRKILVPSALILALAPFVLFPVCDSLKADGTHMACWYSGILITFAGASILLLSLPKKFPALRLSLIALLAVMCWFVPQRIINLPPFGLCAVPEHSCRASTMPAVGLLVIVIIAVSVSGVITSFVRGE